MDKKFDEKEILRLLHELDDHISESCKIIICGGAAIIAGFGIARTTGDIDILEVEPKNKNFFEGVKQVAEENELKSDWLNDGAKGFTDRLHPSYKKRLIPVNDGFKHLNVSYISKPDLITMKICAWRESDKKDIEALHVGQEDLGIVNKNIEYLHKFEPNTAHKARLVLSELNLIQQERLNISDIKTLSELAQYYKQQKGEEPTMIQFVTWKSQIERGKTPKDLAKGYE